MRFTDIINTKKGMRDKSLRSPIFRKFAYTFIPVEPTVFTANDYSTSRIDLTWNNPEVV